MTDHWMPYDMFAVGKAVDKLRRSILLIKIALGLYITSMALLIAAMSLF